MESLNSPYTVAAVVAVVLAVMGAKATSLGPWYYGLNKPPWQPPDWLFGPAWTLIYGLCVWSAGRAWLAAETDAERYGQVLAPFAVNIVLNAAWSFLFFRFRRPDWAFVEVIALWLSVASLVIVLWPLDRLASVLILPYLSWVTFAATLNRTIIRLNAPFGPAARSA